MRHTNHYSVSDNRVDITLDDGGTGSLWWATKNEWLGLLEVAGLNLEALYGGFDGEPLDDRQPRVRLRRPSISTPLAVAAAGAWCVVQDEVSFRWVIRRAGRNWRG